MLTKYRLATADDIGKDVCFTDIENDFNKEASPLKDIAVLKGGKHVYLTNNDFIWHYAYVRIEEENKSLDGDTGYHVSKQEFDVVIKAIADIDMSLCDLEKRVINDFEGNHKRLRNIESAISLINSYLKRKELDKKKNGRGRPKKKK